jgi:hypothetical protein
MQIEGVGSFSFNLYGINHCNLTILRMNEPADAKGQGSGLQENKLGGNKAAHKYFPSYAYSLLELRPTQLIERGRASGRR